MHLSSGDHHAVVVEVSGGVREYTVAGRHLVDGYDARAVATGGRGQLLIPWPNRLRDGRYDFGGVAYQVPLTEPEKHNAIHGFLRWESWQVRERDEDRAVLEHTLHPRAGYPFTLHVSVEYRLDPSGLTTAVTATNLGDSPCPYASGAHPYLRAGDLPIDRWEIEAPGATRLVLDERAIPVGRESVANTRWDFRKRRALGSEALDTAYTDVERDAGGRAWVRIWGGSGDSGVAMWMDEGHPHYMLFTGDTLPDADERRRSVAVEPMTGAPNAFASGDGLIVLSPGESATTRWGITPLGAP